MLWNIIAVNLSSLSYMHCNKFFLYLTTSLTDKHLPYMTTQISGYMYFACGCKIPTRFDHKNWILTELQAVTETQTQPQPQPQF